MMLLALFSAFNTVPENAPVPFQIPGTDVLHTPTYNVPSPAPNTFDMYREAAYNDTFDITVNLTTGAGWTLGSVSPSLAAGEQTATAAGPALSLGSAATPCSSSTSTTSARTPGSSELRLNSSRPPCSGAGVAFFIDG